MAATRLVVGAFVALLCAGVVMSAAPAQQLAKWLEKNAGLKGQKLSSALKICETEEIESVPELRKLHDKGRIDRLGFK